MFKRWYFRFQTRFWLRGAAQKRSSRSAKPSVKHLVGFRTRLLRVSEELDFENWIVENLATLFWFENLIVRNLTVENLIVENFET